jgi:hypothetical protein
MPPEISSQPNILNWIYALVTWAIGAYPDFIRLLKAIVGFLIGLSFPLSFFFLIGIIYCVEGLKKIRNKESDIYELKVEPGFETVKTGDTAMAHRWQNAMRDIESPNQNDWKHAIMECDIILDDLLTKMGYQGDSIGEKLKNVATGDMKSLNEAWEAHKIRNQIAHEGSTFSLNQHEAKNVIGMYKKVFEEFYYI